MKKIILIAAISSLCFALEPKHNCAMPAIPIKMPTNKDIASFNAAVDMYRSCIQRFVDEHAENAKSSTRAMRDADDDWSRFVKLVNASPVYQKHVRPESKSPSPIQAETSPAPFGSHNVGHGDPTKVKANFSF